VSLAHRGVLFLDEAPEFARPVLESLRQPLESGVAVVARAGFTVRFPARFQLVLASNPCPCGGGSGRGETCRCSSLERRRYTARLSGPLLDRVDLRVTLRRPRPSELMTGAPGESTALVAARVAAARDRTLRRLRDTPWTVNAEVPGAALRRRWPPDPAAETLLAAALRDGAGLSLRGADRVLRVAWTLTDLAGRGRPGRPEVAQALAMRTEELAWAA
jgi:magnesium chelatase family protein